MSDFNASFTPDSGYTEQYDGRVGASSGAAPGGCAIYQIGTAASYTPGAACTQTALWCGVAATFADSAPPASTARSSIVGIIG